VLLGDGEQLEGGLGRSPHPLFPGFDGIGTDVEKPGEECLTGIEARRILLISTGSRGLGDGGISLPADAGQELPFALVG
jgi:hypothetical protein